MEANEVRNMELRDKFTRAQASIEKNQLYLAQLRTVEQPIERESLVKEIETLKATLDEERSESKVGQSAFFCRARFLQFLDDSAAEALRMHKTYAPESVKACCDDLEARIQTVQLQCLSQNFMRRLTSPQ